MRLLVFGAAGGVGRHVVRHALAQGHEVVAVVRATVPSQRGSVAGARWVAGDVRDSAVVAAAIPGADAVLWCVGATATSGGGVGRAVLPVVVQVMAGHGVERFVGVSCAAADLPGDTKGRGARLVSAVGHRLTRDRVEDKEQEFAVLAASSVMWSQVRPTRLDDGPGTGRYGLTTWAPGPLSPSVARSDVALAMVDLATDGGAAPTGGDPFRRGALRSVDALPEWSWAAPYLTADPA